MNIVRLSNVCRSSKLCLLPQANIHRVLKLSTKISPKNISQVHRTKLGRDHYRLFSSTVALNEAATSQASSAPLNPLPVEVPLPAPAQTDLIDTSARSQWAQDAADHSGTSDLASLGLGGYSPIGLLQHSMDWIHSHTGMPWWASIIAFTVVMRGTLLPVAIKMQANTARMNSIRPETEKLMAKIKQYKRSGNDNLVAISNKKLLDLYKEHNCSPLKMMATPFLQIPIFISFFIALRRMAAAPVQSLQSGGLWWFTDLTVPDPYYILPITSCALLISTIELGGEAGVINPQMEKMKIAFRAVAILLIPVTAKFPTVLFMYWLPSSIFSIAQILFLRQPSIRSRFGLPENQATPLTTENRKSFLAQIKENYNSAMDDSNDKARRNAAKKRYNTQLEDKAPKLFDKPPHLRKISS